MKLQLVYFDDQFQNLELSSLMFKDDFNIAGFTKTSQFEKALIRYNPHGILLDLHMPEESGVELYKKIISSENYNGCPIFFISADNSDVSRMLSIETGAIDFLARQMNYEELRLRLLSKIQHYLQGNNRIHVGNLCFNADNFTVKINSESIDMTLIETKILSILIKALPSAVDKDTLVSSVWDKEIIKNQLGVHLSNMKMKLIKWDHEIGSINGSVSIHER